MKKNVALKKGMCMVVISGKSLDVWCGSQLDFNRAKRHRVIGLFAVLGMCRTSISDRLNPHNEETQPDAIDDESSIVID